jgi:ATP-dependent protease ClpP protease subunit
MAFLSYFMLYYFNVEKDTDRDFYLTAQEAKEYGIIDKVIQTK